MYFFDYLLSGLAFALLPWISVILLGSRKSFAEINPEVDLFGLSTTEFLNDLDKRFWSRWSIPLSLLLGSVIAYPWIHWEGLDATLQLRNFVVFLSGIVTWKAVTEDIDLATGQKLFKERLMMLFSLVGTFFYPGFLFPLFFIGIICLKGWYHHQVMVWRVLEVFLAYLFAVVIVNIIYRLLNSPVDQMTLASPFFLFLCMIASHYVGPGIKKMKLGKSWYSWAMDNHLHYLAASAYLWGWQRDQKAENRTKMIFLLKKTERILQFGALGFEFGWLLSGFNSTFTVILCCLGVVFHLLVFISSGIFFWQSIGVLGALTSVVLKLPSEMVSQLFNWQNGLLLAAILLLFPLRNKLWELNSLAWWDTPYIGRVHWEVIGESGKDYGLYNNFMTPHERFFGRHYSQFLVADKNFHRHLGEVFDLDLRDAIVSSSGDPNLLALCKEKWGKHKRNETLETMHDLYMIQFLGNFNHGKKRSVCPFF